METLSVKELELLKIIAEKLTDYRKKVATTESCTGGLLAWLLTYLSGSSNYYKGGISAYSNDVKMNVVGVKKETLDEYGAVSKEVAIELANGVRTKLAVDYSISLTGVAGPSGGTKEKPVGTVWCGVSSSNHSKGVLFQLEGSREEIRRQSAILALAELIKIIDNDN